LWWWSDWRLPEIKELETIVDYSIYNPSINTTYFTNTANVRYWSSTTYATSTSGAWIVNFSDGNSNHDTKTNSRYVRCVR
jgi:hypothetical protein